MIIKADRFWIDPEAIIAIEDTIKMPPTCRVTTNVVGGLVIEVTKQQGDEIKRQWEAWHLLNDAEIEIEEGESIYSAIEKAETKN